jgi:hypothetical protein
VIIKAQNDIKCMSVDVAIEMKGKVVSHEKADDRDDTDGKLCTTV